MSTKQASSCHFFGAGPIDGVSKISPRFHFLAFRCRWVMHDISRKNCELQHEGMFKMKQFHGRTTSILMTLVVLSLAANLVAAVPYSIYYQSRLLDVGGAPLDGTFNVTFRIHKQAVGGAVLWNSGPRSVVLTAGDFCR